MRTASPSDPSGFQNESSTKVYLHHCAGQGRRRVAHLLRTLALAGAFFCLLVPVSSARGARFGFPVIRGPYLGERPPHDLAELFSPGIVSTRNREHSSLVVRGDGREMFWAVQSFDFAGRFEEQRIWHTCEAEGAWSEPAPLDVQRPGSRCPVLTPDGKELYFLTDDPDANPADTPPRSLAWVKRANGDSWTEAVPVPDLLPRVRNRGTTSFSFAANGNLYFDLGGPDESGTWRWRIYCAEMRNGMRREPRLLSEGINDGSINTCPYIAPDESFLIFASDRAGGLGDDDLYIAFRTRNGHWTPPLNMGPRVNTAAQERFASISPDGQYLFFARHNSRTLQDYYWIGARIVRDLRLEYALNKPSRERSGAHRNG